MRILHVLGKLDRGGVETWLVQVLRHIDRQKYQMDFLVHTTDPGAYDEEVRALGGRIIPCLSPTNPVQYAFNFLWVLHQHGPYDVVHSHVHHYSGYVLMLAAMAGVKVRIAHSHTSAPELFPGIARRAYLAVMRLLIKRNATLGITISTLAGDSLMAGWRQDPSWYLRPYGIETKPFDTKVDSIAVRKELGLPPKALVVGHVGRFADVKNHKFIIQVASELVKWDSNVVFLLVGDGPMRSEIETELSDRGLSKHFVLTGNRGDIPRIMKGAMDAFVFPSKYEGLGIVVMEAQFAGLCSVVSDVIPSETDLIDNAVIRLPLSVPSIHWAKSLRAILEARLHCSAPDYVRKQHSIAGSVSQLTALYDSGYCDLPTGSVETNCDLTPVEQK
jgi:glycosyltransferase involved in cell wall biosynthesis